MGLVNGAPAAFGALLFFPHPKVSDVQSLSRVVVLPDFQGLGLGAYSFVEMLAKICKANGFRMSTHPSHPALVRTWAKSPLWKMTAAPGFANAHGSTFRIKAKTSNRRVAHFSYIGPAFDTEAEADTAKRMWACRAN